jgi:hypothetical protein
MNANYHLHLSQDMTRMRSFGPLAQNVPFLEWKLVAPEVPFITDTWVAG